MCQDVKIKMKKKARVLQGLLNLLKDDIEQMSSDADHFDLICLEESVKDANDTLRMLSDNVKEMEYYLYLSRQSGSRDLHAPL